MNAKSTKTLNTDLTPEESRDQNELIEKEKKKAGKIELDQEIMDIVTVLEVKMRSCVPCNGKENAPVTGAFSSMLWCPCLEGLPVNRFYNSVSCIWRFPNSETSCG